VLAYYVTLLVHALIALPTSLGSNMLGVIWPLIIVLVGEAIAGFAYGWKFVFEKKLKEFSIIGFAALVACYTLLWVYCAFSLDYSDHSTLSSEVQTLQKANDKSAEHERYAILEARNKCAETVGENRTLGQQNRDQQNTINNCQMQALRLLSPEKLRITTAYYGVGESTEVIKRILVVGLINREVTPIDVTLRCNAEINPIRELSIGTGGAYINRSVHQIDAHTLRLKLESPSWTPVRPLGIELATETGNLTCNFLRN
jgi:hypothetical protein